MVSDGPPPNLLARLRPNISLGWLVRKVLPKKPIDFRFKSIHVKFCETHFGFELHNVAGANGR